MRAPDARRPRAVVAVDPLTPDEMQQKARATTLAIVAGIVAVVTGISIGPLAEAGSPVVFVSILLLVASATLAILAGRRLAHLERAAWLRYCTAHGWTYTPVDRARPKQWPDVPPFGIGNDRKATDVVTGSHKGLAFEAWTYQYTVQHGKSSTTYRHRVGVVPMPRAAPGLTITKETAGHKLYDALGGEDIDFESDEFSSSYWVRCKDRRFAYDVIDARMMEALMGWGTADTWMWNGSTLLVVREGPMKRSTVLEMVEKAQAFRARVPRHVAAAP